MTEHYTLYRTGQPKLSKKRGSMACVRKYRGRWVIDFRDGSGKRHIQVVESRDAGNEKLGQIAKAIRSKTYDPGRARLHFETMRSSGFSPDAPRSRSRHSLVTSTY